MLSLKHTKQLETSVTVLTRVDGRAAGKTFDRAGKHVAHHTGSYHAQVETLRGQTPLELLEAYAALVSSLRVDQSLILGYAADLPESYEIRPKKQLKNPDGINWVDGRPTIARLKHRFTPSRLLLLDFDPDSRMPEDWRGLDEAGRWELFSDSLPEFKGAARLTIPSGSARVMNADGTPIKSGPLGCHTYVVSDRELDKAELDAGRSALEIRLWANNLGYTRPSKSGARLRRTLFDSSVWVAGRELFDGPPNVRSPYKLAPLNRALHAGGCVSIVTTTTQTERQAFEHLTGARIIDRTSDEHRHYQVPAFDNSPPPPRIIIENHTDLRLDTRIVTEIGTLTVEQFLKTKVDKLRCQTPFRESNSWAGILRRTTQGAILHDVGTGITYKLGSDPKPLSGRFMEDIQTLEKELKANVQGLARAILWRHAWRCPINQTWDELLTAICAVNPVVERFDLDSIARYIDETTRKRALEIVKTKKKNKKVSKKIYYHEVADINAVRSGIKAIGKGIHLCKAPHDAGKTEGLIKPIALQRNGVVAIAPRVSLVSDLTQRCNLAHYQNTATDPDLGLCINSIINPKYAESLDGARAILVDEISRIIRDCHNQNSTLGAKAHQVWKRLISLMESADIAIGVDADLNDDDLEMLSKKFKGSIHFWSVREKPLKLTGVFVSDEALMKHLDEAAAEGKRALFIADSAKRVAGLEKVLRKRYPHLRILAIHDHKALSTKGTPEVLRLLSDINAHITEWDIVLMSPTVESGISLNVKHFDCHFALYTGTVETTAFNQMLRRDRTATRWEIAIQGNGLNHYADSYGQVLNGLDASQRRVIELDDGTLIMEPASAYDRDCCTVMACSYRNRNTYGANLWYLLEHRGWKLEHGEREKIQAGKDLRQAAKTELEEAKTTTVCDALDLAASQLQPLREAYMITPEQSAALARAEVRETTGIMEGELTREHVALWQDGKLGSQNRNFDALKNPLGLSERDRAEAEAKIPIALRSWDAARGDAIQAFFKALGLNPETGAGTVTDETAGQAYRTLAGSDIKDVLTHFGLASFNWRTPTYPVRWVNQVLSKLGLYLEQEVRRGADGCEGRSYVMGLDVKYKKDGSLSLPGWNLMTEIRERRLKYIAASVTTLADGYGKDFTDESRVFDDPEEHDDDSESYDEQMGLYREPGWDDED